MRACPLVFQVRCPVVLPRASALTCCIPETQSSLTDHTASVISLDAMERRKEIELLAEESQKLFGDIQARYAFLQSRGNEGTHETVQDDRMPAGMEPFINPPRNHDLWALSLEVRDCPLAVALSLIFFDFQPTACAYDVISQILSKASSEPSCIISSFSPNLSSNIIYIEAWGGTNAIEAFLTGVTAISHLGSNRSRLRSLPRDEWSNALDQPPQVTNDIVSSGTWVRVHKAGRYYGDLGVIEKVGQELGNNIAEVILVPRIQRPGHRSRPLPALFDESTIKNFYPTRAIRRRNGLYEFNSDLFTEDGYLTRLIEIQYLTTQFVDPTEEEVLLFFKSENVTVKNLCDMEMKKRRLRINDRVQVHSGALQGQTGYIVAIDNLGFVSIQEELSSDIFDAPIEEVEKFFLLGDTVRILNGNHEGTCGFIISLDGDVAQVFDPKDLKYTITQVLPSPAVCLTVDSLHHHILTKFLLDICQHNFVGVGFRICRCRIKFSCQ